MIEITRRAINPQRLVNRVIKESNGAVVTFIGTVRSPSEGKVVLSLEYEAYKELAEEKLRELEQEIVSRWKLKDIAISHRVGKMLPGDVAVVIAIGSPHRQEAFEACQYGINRLKEIVPIWKKEFFEDGASWVEGE